MHARACSKVSDYGAERTENNGRELELKTDERTRKSERRSVLESAKASETSERIDLAYICTNIYR